MRSVLLCSSQIVHPTKTSNTMQTKPVFCAHTNPTSTQMPQLCISGMPSCFKLLPPAPTPCSRSPCHCTSIARPTS